jgi:hypothetical protein
MDIHKTNAELSVLSSGDEVRHRPARYGLMTSVLSEMIFATKKYLANSFFAIPETLSSSGIKPGGDRFLNSHNTKSSDV